MCLLKVISRSALDVQKVLDALVESAARLCGAYDVAIFQVFGDDLRLVAHYGQLPTSGPVGQLTRPLVRGALPGRVVLDRQTIQVADMLAEADDYPEIERLRGLRAAFRAMPDEDPSDRGLAELMAAARAKADEMKPTPWWQ